jgi:hypothetical protein
MFNSGTRPCARLNKFISDRCISCLKTKTCGTGDQDNHFMHMGTSKVAENSAKQVSNKKQAAGKMLHLVTCLADSLTLKM